MNPIIKDITAAQVKTAKAAFKVGDAVRVHTKVREGDKERVQVFAGVVIAHKGSGIHETFTVRRISYGEGVERVFPLYSPMVGSIEVVRRGSDGENAIARGLAQYDAAELRRIRGRPSHAIESVLGYPGAETAIHRDDLVLL